ncbi:glutamate formimidoyltransferase [Athalassotoga saccharophila]|uniref:glutamate formimidoyltransferase n=1 Tax=Athalassotoga saccharophila TaxID=1441386 RepID=UPI00137AB2B3|nr:glutamate formimidoyltransferase [Athalassotoga saccharophila]
MNLKKLIESVPNFSEGRREEVVKEIVKMAEETDNVWVFDWSMDKDHNRSVITIVGDPEGVSEAIFKMSKKAVELIDLRHHTGEHPRMGSVDVIPFIPIRGSTMEECIEISKKVGKRIGEELKVPVYLYEKSATTPLRENLADIRKGEFEGFFEKIKLPEWAPDFGPSEVHPTAGVVAVGAREYLIAFNVNLGTKDLKIAENIAKAVRNSSGGYRFVKAIGVDLKEKGIVQVSMNMTNYKKSPLHRVFETIRIEAERYGVPIVGSEIIGMIPMDAIIQTYKFYLRIDDLSSDKVIENKLLDKISEF